MLNNKLLCIDNLSENDLVNLLEESEKNIENGRFYTEEEFFDNTNKFINDLDNVNELQNNINKLYKKMNLEQSVLSKCTITLWIDKINRKIKYALLKKIPARTSKELFTEKMHNLLENFYLNEIETLSSNWNLYKSISGVELVLSVDSYSNCCKYQTLSGLSYAIDKLEKA